MNKIAIVTDSAACVPEPLIKQYGIHVPMVRSNFLCIPKLDYTTSCGLCCKMLS
jgi:hypothetical protein